MLWNIFEQKITIFETKMQISPMKNWFNFEKNIVFFCQKRDLFLGSFLEIFKINFQDREKIFKIFKMILKILKRSWKDREKDGIWIG